MRYTVTCNVPGYLPEDEPHTFDTFDEAKRYVIHELKYEEGVTPSEDDAETYCHLAEDVNLESRPFCTPVLPNGYVYEIQSEE